MKNLKFTIRLIIAILLITPTVIGTYAILTMFGVFFLAFLGWLLLLIFSWLKGDKAAYQESKEIFNMILYLITSPFIFWLNFIKE